MKVISILLLAVYSLQALPTKELLSAKWENFKLTHGKQYVNINEETMRKEIFSKKLEQIEEHNKKYEQGLVTYKIGLNKFSDLTEEEMLLPRPETSLYRRRTTRTFIPQKDAQYPESKDWRDEGVVPPVKDQGSCGSSWAFSTTAAIESHYRIYKEEEISLSEQQLVDCVGYAHGCRGGFQRQGFSYAEGNGINTESDYPYEAVDGRCRYDESKTHYSVSGFADVESGNEEALLAAVAEKGPVSVLIEVSGNFTDYESGVYYNPDCGSTGWNYVAVVVGYGTEDGQDYWLVRNSWGDQWGDHGYIKMARNRDGNCEIDLLPEYPIL